MLACLPAPGDPAIRLLPRTQMNTGPQKWETTQKMRSASHPTPAELDAYAKKVANKPLTIQIFPNSIKVPQKKHVRRTVNGLDTSSSGQRHSPYPPQAVSSGGLLAVLRAPLKGLIKHPDGCRTRQQLKAVMNPQTGPYAAQSTLNLPHPPPPHLGGLPQKQGAVHPQALQQNMTHPMALQHHHPQALQQRSMAHSQALQQQHSMSRLQGAQTQRLAHPQGVQRQPHPQEGQSCSLVIPQQHLPHVQTLKHQAAPPQALLAQQGVTQDLRHASDGGQLQGLQELVGPQAVPNSLQQPPPGQYAPRKLPDADAPPNVTVSTSTIPLSMAASLHQNRPGDLSSIVNQINQLCQARAGTGATSVCEGQIANPSPISRNQLISASSRVSSQHAAVGGVSSCLMMGHPDKAAAQTPGTVLHAQPSANANNMASFHSDGEKAQQLQQHLLQQQKQQQHLQQLQQQQRSWAQHQLAHMQQPPEGAHPCKNPRMEPPAECAFPSQNLSYAHKLPSSAQGFPLKHPTDKPLPPSPASCSVGPVSYINGHYMQPSWSSVPTTAGNNGNIPQDLPVGFQGDRIPGAKYRPGKDGLAGQSKLMQQSMDFLGEGFQLPALQEQNLDMMHKMHRSALGHVKEPGNSGGVHSHHPGYH
ncbi:protein FAM222B-like [Cyprinodon tularosa]|uniref:protein FAM222B-like n=1 Tax=Cyprinodon tularosa TaxID=77115 RepID=UPI0018E230F3|nr:protein FAM222B-like [Cyprinodon tularosa]XP_038140802.1 protein FAM222B-like [Cyprinodon tularosa]